MEALISEMTMILEQLPDDTNIGIAAFALATAKQSRMENHPTDWLPGDEGKRESAWLCNSLTKGKSA